MFMRADQRRNSILFILAVSSSSLGNGLFLSILVVYLTTVVGYSTTYVGALIGGAGLAGAVFSLLFGWLSDRLLARDLFAALLVLQSMATLCICMSTQRAIVAVAIVASGIFESGAVTARSTLVARLVVPDERVRFRATVRSFANGAVAVGAGLGAIILAVNDSAGYLAAILGDVATFWIASLLICRISIPTVPRHPVRNREEAGLSFSAFRDLRYIIISALTAVLASAESILTVAMPLWVSVAVDAPLWVVSVLLITNTLGVVLCQVRVSLLANTVHAASVTGFRAGVSLALCCIMLSLSSWVSGVWLIVVLVVAGVFQTAAELLCAAAGWALSYGLAPETRIGEYQGVYSCALDLGSFIFPIIFGVVVGAESVITWLLLAAGYLLSGIVLIYLVSGHQNVAGASDEC